MKYQISTFNKYTDSQDFLKFCKESSLEVEQSAAQNMWTDDWQNFRCIATCKSLVFSKG